MNKFIQLLKRVRALDPNAELRVTVFDLFVRAEIRFTLGTGLDKRLYSFTETQDFASWDDWVDTGMVDAMVAQLEVRVAVAEACVSFRGEVRHG